MDGRQGKTGQSVQPKQRHQPGSNSRMFLDSEREAWEMREGLGHVGECTQGNRGCAGPLLGRNNKSQSGGHTVDTEQAGGSYTLESTGFRGSPSGALLVRGV